MLVSSVLWNTLTKCLKYEGTWLIRMWVYSLTHYFSSVLESSITHSITIKSVSPTKTQLPHVYFTWTVTISQRICNFSYLLNKLTNTDHLYLPVLKMKLKFKCLMKYWCTLNIKNLECYAIRHSKPNDEKYGFYFRLVPFSAVLSGIWERWL